MYHAFFGLTESAFSIAVNPRYLYMSEQHHEALAHIVYGVESGGFVCLTGEVGTGKTTIVRKLLEQLPSDVKMAIVLNPMASATEVLQTICQDLDAHYYSDNTTLKSLIDAIHDKLLSNYQKGTKTVLLIDEAQLLNIDTLEQIRLLTNLETNTEKLLQIILVGQPELNDLLQLPRLRQLSQRIIARFHLNPLTIQETRAYISHRLSVAGLNSEVDNPFTSAIISKVHGFSQGIPRLINVICERLLIGAYAHNKKTIDNNIWKKALLEVTGNTAANTPASRFNQPVAIGVVSLCILVLGVLGFTLLKTLPDSVDTISAAANAEQTITVQTPTTTPSSAPSPILWVKEKNQSERLLLQYLGFNLNTHTPPCWQLADMGYACKKTDVKTWKALQALNRPSVITLIDEQKTHQYAVIIGINQFQAQLIASNGQIHTYPLEALSQRWQGQVFYIWASPKGYTEPLKRGQRSPIIAASAIKFAVLDNQKEPLTDDVFSPAFEQRVRIFQKNQSLTVDGQLNQKTLMKLFDAVGESFMLMPPEGQK